MLLVTATNNQPAPTPAPYHLRIALNPSLYTGDEAADLGNLRFSTSLNNSGPLTSWLEYVSSTPANQAATAYFWVRLPNGIAANSSVNFYLNFLPLTTEFDGVQAGEAPQLSPTYGEYDNGPSVFLAYYRGDSITGWTLAGSAGTTTAPGTPPKGASALYADSTNGDYLYIDAGTNPNGDFLLQFFAYTNGLGDTFFSCDSSGAGQMSRLDQRGGGDYSGLARGASWTKWNCPATGVTSLNDTWYLFTIIVTNGQVANYQDDTTTTYDVNGSYGTLLNALGPGYTDACGGGPETYNPAGGYLGLVGDGLGGSFTTYWQGIIARAYPPNGVDPTVSLAPVPAAPTLAFGSSDPLTGSAVFG